MRRGMWRRALLYGVVLVAVGCAGAVALAGPVKHGATAHVINVSADPDRVAAGDATQASVEVANRGDTRSRARTLFLRLRPADSNNGARILAHQRIPRLAPGAKLTELVDVPIPAEKDSGDYLLMACRAHVRISKCGISRNTTPLTVTKAQGGPGPGPGPESAALAITPTTKSYGSVATATTSPAQTFTVTNTGGEDSGKIDTSLGGADPDRFTKSADTCDGTVLTSGDSCTVTAAFSPTAVGAKSATLEAGADPGGSAKAALDGTGTKPAKLTIAPTSNDFGSAGVGANGTAKSLTVTNTGGVPSGVLTTPVQGEDVGSFVKTDDLCKGTVLGPGQQCTIEVTFKPTKQADNHANLTAVATPGGTARADFVGNGLRPAQLHVSPSTQAFGSVPAGTNSADETFEVTNLGAAQTGAVSITVGGTNPGQFKITADTCDGNVLGGVDSCDVTVHFHPLAPGSKSATITVAANPGGTWVINLSGTGT
jgi:hypothetical protein